MQTTDNAADGQTKADTNDSKLLKELRDFVDQSIKAESDNRAAAVDDLKFEAGHQWPENTKAERDRDGRPCLTFNRLPTYKRQVTNEQRMNKPAIKVSPVGGGATKEAAKIYQGLIRHIEYASNADIAYDTAVNSAASIGWGFWRLVTEYESPLSFNQVIKFKRERDALKVFWDSASTEADGSDAKRCAIVWDTPKADFEREYPGAASDNGAGVVGAQLQPGWMDGNFVRVVEYYYFEYEKRTIYLLDSGEVVEKLPAGVKAKAERETMVPQLKWVKATAGKVLERADIKCRWIPVFPVWGNEIDIQGKVVRSGIIRDAKDPARMYNFWMTSATEEVTLRPKSPFIGAKGQFEGMEKKWAQANRRSFPFLEYNPVTVDGNLAPAPQRAPMADVPVGMLQMAMHAADNIKAVTGLFDASLGAQGNATSGVQEQEQQRQGDVANFHYVDNLNRSIRHCGRCLVDMIPHYYDAQRVVKIMNEDETISDAEVNVPAVDPDTGGAVVDPVSQVQKVLNDLTVGDYDITIGTGPSFQTRRQEAARGMKELATAWPKLMDVAGDKVVENMDWNGADQIAERIKKTIPPQLTAGEGADDQEPIPPAAQQQISQLMQQVQQGQQAMQQMQEELANAKHGITRAQIETESRERIAAGDQQTRRDLEELRGMVKLLVEHVRPPKQIEQAVAQAAIDNHFRPAASQAADPAQPGPTDAMSGS